MKRKDTGHYRYGEVHEGHRKRGTWEIMKGKTLNEHGHEEYSGFIGLMESKWFVVRIYNAESARRAGAVKTDLEDYFDTKKEAKNHLDRKIGNKVNN